MIPTTEEIEGYLESLEELFWSSTSSVPDFPHVKEAVHRLWDDISRFGPPGWSSFPDIHLPSLGDFEIPPPPPPPPPPRPWWVRSGDWFYDHPKTTAGIVVGIAGVGLLAGYGSFFLRKNGRYRKMQSRNVDERRQAIVVLGGDTPMGLPLILELERQGFIVIASVSNPEAVDELEHKCHGFVRALVLDPSEPDTLSFFLRSFSSTLSRRFPITSAGDPYASPLTGPYVHSVISLLTLPSPSILPDPAPLEHLSLKHEYLPYLTITHITPLQVIQALLPLLRSTPARARDYASSGKEEKSIIVCLPVKDARVGLPFAAAQAMSAAATLRGVEVLRREILVASSSDPSGCMKNIKVVVVDVGDVAPPRYARFKEPTSVQDMFQATEDWTPSEKNAYGTAFMSLAEQGRLHGGRRTPTDVAQFVDSLVGVVSGGRKGNSSLFGFGLGLGRIRNWIRGERFSIGAGAGIYTLASYLPRLVLDALLNIPHFLVSIRNALLPVPPRVHPSSAAPPTGRPAIEGKTAEDSAPSSDQEHQEDEDHDNASEADVESNADIGAVAESWVNLWDRDRSVDTQISGNN